MGRIHVCCVSVVVDKPEQKPAAGLYSNVKLTGVASEYLTLHVAG